MCDVKVADAGIKRHRLVLAGFVAQGTSLRRWCLDNGIAPQNAHKALSGSWTGKRASEVIASIVKASGDVR